MQAVRRCVRCNTENGPEQIYCVKCGKFLPKEGKSSRNVTIWDMGDDKDNNILAADKSQIRKKFDATQKYAVICPQCRSATAVENGIIPLACDQCGYFFQAGIDRIVPEPLQKAKASDFVNVEDRRSLDSAKTIADKLSEKRVLQRKGPLAGAKRDTSTLRLIILSRNGAIPENVKENGEIIGANGTVLKTIKTDQQISVWHSPAGWYVRILSGSPLYNGVPMNVGMQIKLSDGDILTVEKNHVRVEII